MALFPAATKISALGSGGPAKAAPEKPMGEVNTTPLIDVMLVLLIMFILTIPIQTHSVKVELPTPGPKTETHMDKNKLVIDAQSRLFWNGTMVDGTQLDRLLADTQKFDVEPELQFQPHERARYLVVDETLASIKRAGVGKLGFVGNEQYARVF